MSPALFKAITKVKTEKGLMWERILTNRQVLIKKRKIIMAASHDDANIELEGPTKMHDLLDTLFAKIWAHPDFRHYYTSPNSLNLRTGSSTT